MRYLPGGDKSGSKERTFKRLREVGKAGLNPPRKESQSKHPDGSSTSCDLSVDPPVGNSSEDALKSSRGTDSIVTAEQAKSIKIANPETTSPMESNRINPSDSKIEDVVKIDDKSILAELKGTEMGESSQSEIEKKASDISKAWTDHTVKTLVLI